MVTGDNPEKVRLGYWLLIPGAFFSAGGFVAITYLFIRDYRAKLTATIRGARLFVEEVNPGHFCWRLFVSLIVTPPDGHVIRLTSDNTRARLDGLVEHLFPIEFSSVGVSPLTNPIIADGKYTEQTVAEEMGVFCDGVTYLTMTPGMLTFPQRLVYDLELMDVAGDWFVVVESDLYLVRPGEYGGFPDLEKPLPERE